MHHYHSCNGTYGRKLEALLLLHRGAPLHAVSQAYGILPAELLCMQRNAELPKSNSYPWTYDLERQLYHWYMSTQCRQFITDKMIEGKAMEIYYTATGTWCSPSQHWLEGWKDRYGIISVVDRKTSRKKLSIHPRPSIGNNVDQYQQQSQLHNSQPTIIQNPPKPQTSIEYSYSFENYSKSSTTQNAAQEGNSLNKLAEQELEDDDEIVKELDNMLSRFHQKVIDSYKECDEDSNKRSRNNDITSEPKAKMLVTENQVAQTFLDCSFPATMKDICPNIKLQNDIEMVSKQEKTDDSISVANIGEIAKTEESSEEDTQTDNEGDISDNQEYKQDDSETSSLISVIESLDEEDEDEEELDPSRKANDSQIDKKMIQEENSISSNCSSIEVLGHEKAGTKNSESHKNQILKIDTISDERINVKEENTEITTSAVSNSKDYQVITIDSSCGEESDEENINNENEESDDDVILIENKSEIIVIDTSDGEEGEQNYQEEPIHQHSQFKIILLNTKEGDKDFSIVDPETLETEPRVFVFQKE